MTLPYGRSSRRVVQFFTGRGMKKGLLLVVGFASLAAMAAEGPPVLPEKARVALSEDWAGGAIDPAKWYVLRKKWGNGNNGVVPENVTIARDSVGGREQNVLVCEAHGDEYDGAVVGLAGAKTRVGGVIVSKAFFASGRFEIVMKIGATQAHEGGPADPRQPKGCIPALWTYAYRYVEVGKERMHEFVADAPLYNPHMPRYGSAINEYWSEIDFPELGKGGDFSHGLYNTYLQTREDSRPLEVVSVADGQYHAFITDWHTKLEPLAGVTDAQVVEHLGFWWIKDKSIPFARYDGNPLKRLGKDDFAVYRGEIAEHWIDGKKIGENKRYIPAMAAQLNMGVWLPDWAGPAAWKMARVYIASVKVWQTDEPGDVRGVLTTDIKDNFDKLGKSMR